VISGAMYADVSVFLGSLAMTQPRILAACAMLPIFNRQVMPGMIRYGVAAAMGLVLVPVVMPQYAQIQPDAVEFAVLIGKEAFIGLLLGFMFVIPFWVFEAIGFLIDNQRGASIGATINPLTGNDTSPLGILLNQAFIVFFMAVGGFTLMLSILYDSFRVWDIWTFFPSLHAEHGPLLLDQISRMLRLTLLLAAPVVITMFLAELGLGLISRFTPQLQVFFLAMPIKSALAMLVLIVYAVTLFDYAIDMIEEARDIIPFLDGQWRSP